MIEKCTTNYAFVLEYVHMHDKKYLGARIIPVTNISLLRKNLFTSIENVIEYNDSIIVNTKKEML